MRKLRYLTDLLAHVENPVPILLDRFGLKRRPYLVRLKSGLVFELRPGLGDRFALFEVGIRGDYTRHGQRILPGDTVIDVGANIGCFSLLAAQLVGSTGRVIAIEPNSHTFRCLVRNIDLNDAQHIEPLNLAIGHDERTAVLHSVANGLFSSVYSQVDGKAIDGTLEDVQVTTLGAIMQSQNVDRCSFLKLDCEGSEYDIVESIEQDVATRIDQITMEIHQVPNKHPKAIIASLNELGFTLMDNRNPHFFSRRSEESS